MEALAKKVSGLLATTPATLVMVVDGASGTVLVREARDATSAAFPPPGVAERYAAGIVALAAATPAAAPARSVPMGGLEGGGAGTADGQGAGDAAAGGAEWTSCQLHCGRWTVTAFRETAAAGSGDWLMLAFAPV